MTTNTTTARTTAVAITAGTRRLYAVSIGVSALFVVFQYFTSGEFITVGIPKDTREFWTNLHGFGAYPVMAFALLATIVGFARLRDVRGLTFATAAYFAATVIQWLLGHAISTLGIDALTPVHVVVAAAVMGLAVWLSVRSARLRRAAD
jgi:lipopolysaccharide export LptBFGC system permease protein LptF